MIAKVVFSDTSMSSDLSALQVDQDSSYMAEDTAFVGFLGEVQHERFWFMGSLSRRNVFYCTAAVTLCMAACGAFNLYKEATE